VSPPQRIPGFQGFVDHHRQGLAQIIAVDEQLPGGAQCRLGLPMITGSGDPLDPILIPILCSTNSSRLRITRRGVVSRVATEENASVKPVW